MPGRITSAYSHSHDEKPAEESKRLILCFDGTGNIFSGTPRDTNIVKLYNTFDRSNDLQMHYYQPGIGTYPAEGPVNVTWFRALMRKFEAVIDTALATSFDSHVIAGYRFVMRHYRRGDKIYIFGFSRGAYTARFLSRMISKVGLLSIGNDELVPFAYKVYQEFEQNGSEDERTTHRKYMESFKRHFCRTEQSNADGVKVHFLGLFDCVGSVGNLDVPLFQKAAPLPAADGTAAHVRHAVAVDERRVKFKAALFAQEPPKDDEDIKEVWFPGNHGDVGGGWDVTKEKETGCAHDDHDIENDHFQLSDIALKWMINEIDDVEAGDMNRIAWDPKTKDSYLRRFEEHTGQMLKASMHDTMKFGGGSKNPFKILLWNFMEYLPWIIKRWEFVEKPKGCTPKSYQWQYIGWPVNMGGRRDIPSTALLHSTVKRRLERKDYTPTNSLWVRAHEGFHYDAEPIERNLKELALNARSAGGRRGSETQPLTEPEIHFVHHSTGKVAAEKINRAKGKEEWDDIYRVARRD